MSTLEERAQAAAEEIVSSINDYSPSECIPRELYDPAIEYIGRALYKLAREEYERGRADERDAARAEVAALKAQVAELKNELADQKWLSAPLTEEETEAMSKPIDEKDLVEL